jgi:Protein of unknown function (DUF3108)
MMIDMLKHIRNLFDGWQGSSTIILLPGLLMFVLATGDTTRVVRDTVDVDSPGSFAEPDSAAKVAGPGVIIQRNSAPLSYPTVDNKAFLIGEKLTFDISYGFIHAGTATMEVQREVIFNNRNCYNIQTTAKSASGFNFIYKVEDVVETYMDKQGLFSWKFDKRLREGSYKADLQAIYYPGDSLACVSFTRYKSRMKVHKQQNYNVKTPPFVLDILAALYYTRTQKLEVGKSIFLTNHDNKKIYDLEVKVFQKETVETDAGRFECLLIEPILKGEGLFKQKGRMQIWLTNDLYKIPVLMTTEIAVGHITTELVKIEGIKGKIPARQNSNE